MTRPPVRVLVIDDSPVDQELIRRQLMRCKKAAFEVITASSAADGLAAVRDLSPDVVLLDHGMPVEDGFAVLRGLEKGKAPPIVVLTGREDEATVVEALALGASGYLPKSAIMTSEIAEACLKVCRPVRTSSPRPSLRAS